MARNSSDWSLFGSVGIGRLRCQLAGRRKSKPAAESATMAPAVGVREGAGEAVAATVGASLVGAVAGRLGEGLGVLAPHAPARTIASSTAPGLRNTRFRLLPVYCRHG